MNSLHALDGADARFPDDLRQERAEPTLRGGVEGARLTIDDVGTLQLAVLSCRDDDHALGSEAQALLHHEPSARLDSLDVAIVLGEPDLSAHGELEAAVAVIVGAAMLVPLGARGGRDREDAAEERQCSTHEDPAHPATIGSHHCPAPAPGGAIECH